MDKKRKFTSSSSRDSKGVGMKKHDQNGAPSRRAATARPAAGSKPPFPSKDKLHKTQDGGVKKGFKAKDGGKANEDPTKLSKKERKEKTLERKIKLKKNYVTVHEVVTLWEQARPDDVTNDQRRELVQTMSKATKGKVADVACNHAASRCIQFLLKHGTPEVKKSVIAECNASLLTLAKHPYGHFVARKVIEAEEKSNLPAIHKILKHHICELLRHPCGSTVVDELYHTSNPHQRSSMVAEFYGREFTLFDQPKDAPHRLVDLLRDNPAKRRAILANVAVQLTPILEKGLVDPAIVHRVLCEYLENALPLAIVDAAETMASATVLRIVHTKEGAKAAAIALAALNAKGRKKMIKGFKGQIMKVATDETGHLLILTALCIVDDTALLRKSIISELSSSEAIVTLANDRWGRRVLLQLLSPDNTRFIPQNFAALLHPATIPVSKEDKEKKATEEQTKDVKKEGEDEDEEPEEEAPKKSKKAAGGEDGGSDDEEGGDNSGSWKVDAINVSKKDGAVRRRELLGQGKGSLAQSLVQVCIDSHEELLRDQNGCDVILEVARGGGSDAVLVSSCGCKESLDKLHQAIATSCQGHVEKNVKEGEQAHLLVDYWASRTLRRLIVCSTEKNAACASTSCSFAEKLWSSSLEGQVSNLIGSHADKVLAALATCGSTKVSKACKAELAKAVKGKLDEWLGQFDKHAAK